MAAPGRRDVVAPTIDISKLKWNDEVLPVDDLIIDARYQRHTVQRLVDAISANYNPLLAGKLIVSHRNGDSFIVDGQQRWHGARAAGVEKVACIGIAGLDYNTEARLFLALNQSRVSVRALDNFRAAWVSGEPYAVTINEVVENCGGRIHGINQPAKDNDIQAVEALRWIYKRGGRRGLQSTLELITQAFGELTQDTCPGIFSKGLFGVISLHQDLDRDRLARTVAGKGTQQISSLAHGMGQLLGATAGQRSFYLAILQTYNEKLGKTAIEPAHTMHRVTEAWSEDE